MAISELSEFRSGGTREQPKWQSLVSYLSRELMRGNYRPGDVLPSENHIAKTTGFARSTVRQAFSHLEKEGFVKRFQGKGTVVAERQAKNNGQMLEMFGLIMPEIRRTLYPSLVKGFDEGATRDHHQVMICNTDNSIDKQGNIILQLLDKGVAGVAIVPTTFKSTPVQHIRYLQSNDVPVVFCHRFVEGVAAPCVSWEAEDVGRIAGQAFIDHGHREIMYFGVYRYHITQAHEYGLRAVLERNGISLPAERVLYGPSACDDDDEQKEQILRDVLGQKNRPTAILCSDDTEAERVYWIAAQLGLKIPDDLSIVGFGDIHRDTVFRKQLASVVVDELELGKRTADILCKMCNGDKPIENDENYYMNLQFINGGTLSIPSRV